MEYIFIVNPKANRGKNKEIEEKIKKACQKRNLKYKIEETYRPGAATKMAKEYQNEEKIIYAVGGDGLVSEVANGIVGSKNILGVIPAGSGNDFYRTCKNLEDGRHLIDIGKINQKYFINTACVGMDADSASNVFRMKKLGIPKNWLYTASVLYTFSHYKMPKISIKVNGQDIYDNLTMLAICNGRYYGGGYMIAPSADLKDGMFDIYFVGDFPKLKMPIYLMKIRKGKHEDIEAFKIFKTNKIKISSKKRIRFNIDGEMMSSNEFDIEIIKDGIEFYQDREFVNEIIEK